MDNLKFRVWDKKRDKMLLPYENEGLRIITIGGYISLIHCFQNSIIRNENWHWENYDDKDVIIQQFIGLKDSKEKEIYCGDILKFREEYLISIHEKKIYHIGEVKFSAPRFYIDGPRATFQDCEILGNIFENKELLNEQS